MATAYLFNRARFLPLTLIFLAAVLWERNALYLALQSTNSFWEGYRLGELINRNVPAEETAYVIAGKDFIESQNLFVSFYADRQIIYLPPDAPLPKEAKSVFNLDR